MIEEQLKQYLIFMLQDEKYGVTISSVKEIIEYGQVTRIPMMPDFVKGVINLRGDVVPVVDLSIRFGFPATRVLARSCIVILEVQHEAQLTVIGVVVDAVNEVEEFDSEQIEAAPKFGARIRADFIQGVIKIDEEFAILLEADRVLSVDEMTSIVDAITQ